MANVTIKEKRALWPKPEDLLRSARLCELKRFLSNWPAGSAKAWRDSYSDSRCWFPSLSVAVRVSVSVFLCVWHCRWMPWGVWLEHLAPGAMQIYQTIQSPICWCCVPETQKTSGTFLFFFFVLFHYIYISIEAADKIAQHSSPHAVGCGLWGAARGGPSVKTQWVHWTWNISQFSLQSISNATADDSNDACKMPGRVCPQGSL